MSRWSAQIYMAEAMIQNHDNAHAQQELERALLRADKIGLKPLSAKAHYLLGTVLRASGNQVEAQQHYRDALQLLDDMRKEPGADKILQRSTSRPCTTKRPAGHKRPRTNQLRPFPDLSESAPESPT